MTHKIKLATVCQQIRGVSYTPKDMAEIPTEGYIPILRANNIQEKLVFNELVYVNANKISEIQLLKGGDIVVCASSGSKNLVGKAARFVSSPVDQVSFGAFCKVVRPRNIDASYLSHFFNSSYYRNTISKIAQGASINNIRNEHLDNLDINVPTPSEQKRIAKRLDKVQELIAKQKEQIAKLDLLIKSRFLDMFGDPISNPKKWPCQSLSNVAPKQSRKVATVSSAVWLLNLDQIEGNNGRVIKKERLDSSELGNSILPFYSGEVLYSKLRPYLNKVVLADEDGFCTTELLPLHPQKEICNALFLAHLLRQQSVVVVLSIRVVGAKMPRVDLTTLRNLLIPLPPLSLQSQFANFVKSVEQQKEVFSARLSHFETLYKSLMQEYFG